MKYTPKDISKAVKKLKFSNKLLRESFSVEDPEKLQNFVTYARWQISKLIKKDASYKLIFSSQNISDYITEKLKLSEEQISDILLADWKNNIAFHRHLKELEVLESEDEHFTSKERIESYHKVITQIYREYALLWYVDQQEILFGKYEKFLKEVQKKYKWIWDNHRLLLARMYNVSGITEKDNHELTLKKLEKSFALLNTQPKWINNELKEKRWWALRHSFDSIVKICIADKNVETLCQHFKEMIRWFDFCDMDEVTKFNIYYQLSSSAHKKNEFSDALTFSENMIKCLTFEAKDEIFFQAYQLRWKILESNRNSLCLDYYKFAKNTKANYSYLMDLKIAWFHIKSKNFDKAHKYIDNIIFNQASSITSKAKAHFLKWNLLEIEEGFIKALSQYEISIDYLQSVDPESDDLLHKDYYQKIIDSYARLVWRMPNSVLHNHSKNFLTHDTENSHVIYNYLWKNKW